MSTIDILQSLSSNLLSTTKSSSTSEGNLIEQTFGNITEGGEKFSDILTKIQGAETQDASNVGEPLITLDTVTDNLNTMQDDLLSNLLGYHSGINALVSTVGEVTDNFEEFSLDSVKKSIQNNILGALQANDIIPKAIETDTEDFGIVTNLVNAAFNKDGIGLEDAFDTVNFLNHIPVVSSLYSDVTEQEDISTFAKLAGDYMYGGPVGLAFSVLDLAFESYTGTSISDAITEFDYSDFIFGNTGSDNEEASFAETVVDSVETVFFDKDKNVLYTRE